MDATIIYEDNTICIAQLKEGYIKGDRTKHISPNYFSLMIFRRMMISTFNKFVRVIILQMFSQSNSQVKFLRNFVLRIGLHRLRGICLHEGEK